MSSSRSIMQPLFKFSTDYSRPLALDKNMGLFEQIKPDFQYISNVTQIMPPSVWFTIDQNRCFSSIKNDTQRSKQTRMGLFVTNSKGNLLNKITSLNTQSYEQDIGTIQQTQQSFCVSFAVVKDTCQEYLRHIASQLRLCMIRKPNLIDQTHLRISQLDQISKFIYSKYRIFLIFDAKSQPGRILSIQSCFYPNVRFNIQRFKKKEKQILKFSPNQVLQQIQRVEILNTFGFLTLDRKQRLLMIKKDDPQLSKQPLIGVWVVGMYPTNRTKKQFGKDDAIWAALLDYYTNPQIKNKLSILQKNKGFLCYITIKKQKNKIDSPQFYLFQQSTKQPPKWSFTTKSQFITDWAKSYQIKIEFINNIIIEQRQYSEFSDQTNTNQQFKKTRNQNFNRENMQQDQVKPSKNNQYLANQSGFSGSSQSKQKKNRHIQELQQKNKTITELTAQLKKYKQRCIELETINKILMQQKVMNSMIYQNQMPMMNQPHPPPIYHYGQMPGYSYPLSYSQVSASNYQPLPVSQQIRNSNIQQNNYVSSHSPTNQKLNILKTNQVTNSQNEKQKKPVFSFPQTKPQQMSFGNQKHQQIKSNKIQQKQRLFIKKSQSYGPQSHVEQQEHKVISPKPQQKLKANPESKKQAQIRKDVRNISFQDSFAEYHSDEDEVPNFKFGQQNQYGYLGSNQIPKKSNVQKTERISSNNQQDSKIMKSPQFKRVQSLEERPKKVNQRIDIQEKVLIKDNKQELKGGKNQNSTTKTDINTKLIQPVKVKQLQSKNENEQKDLAKQKNSIIKKYEKTLFLHQNDSDKQQNNKKIQIKKPKQIEKPEAQVSKRKVQKQDKSSSQDSDQTQNLKRFRIDYFGKR